MFFFWGAVQWKVSCLGNCIIIWTFMRRGGKCCDFIGGIASSKMTICFEQCYKYNFCTERQLAVFLKLDVTKNNFWQQQIIGRHSVKKNMYLQINLFVFSNTLIKNIELTLLSFWIFEYPYEVHLPTKI